MAEIEVAQPKTYITSKETCERNIKGVCEGCGGSLAAIETVDNLGRPTFWQGCEHCSCFCAGIEPEYFTVARKLVEDNTLLPYSHMNRCEYENTPERLAYFFSSQTAGLSFTIRTIHRLLEEACPTSQRIAWLEKKIELAARDLDELSLEGFACDPKLYAQQIAKYLRKEEE